MTQSCQRRTGCGHYRQAVRVLIPLVVILIPWGLTASIGVQSTLLRNGLSKAQLEARCPSDVACEATSRATAIAPFVVLIDWSVVSYEGTKGAGEGRRELHFWCFGCQLRLRTWAEWRT